MSEKNRFNKPAAAAAIAGLLSAVGVAGPAQAASHEAAGKVASLRAATAENASGSILGDALTKREAVTDKDIILFGQFAQFLQFGQIIIRQPDRPFIF